MPGQSASQKRTPRANPTAAVDSTGRLLTSFRAQDVATATHAAPFMSRIVGGKQSASMLVLGDSTGDESNVQGRWVLKVAQWLAAAFPAYTVNFRQWNLTNSAWDALGANQSRVLQVGTGTGNSGGPFVIDIWNQSASGQSPVYHYSNGLIGAAMPLTSPQLVLINHGHNIGSDAGVQTAYQIGILARTVLDLDPRVGLIVTAQNPDGPTASDYANDYLRARTVQSLAALEGYGLVNVFQRFLKNPSYVSQWISSTDGLYIHPSDAGSMQWATEVEAALWLGADSALQPQHAFPGQNRLFIPAKQFEVFSGTPTYVQMSTNGFGWNLPSAQASYIVASGVAVPAHWAGYDTSLVWTTAGSSGYSGSTTANIALGRQVIGSASIPIASQYAPDAWTEGSFVQCVPHNGSAYQTFFSSLATQSSYGAKNLMNLRIRRSASDTLPESVYVIGVMLTKASAAL